MDNKNTKFDINDQDKNGNTLIMIASIMDNYEILKYLLDFKKININ